MSSSSDSPDLWLGGFSRFLSAVDPSAPAKLEGESPEAIARLETALGFPLPRPYVEFLRLMGKGSGDLGVAWSSYTDVDTLLKWHDAEPLLADGRLVFAVAPDGGYFLSLDLEDPARLAVASNASGEWITYARSLSGFCHHRAFFPVHRARFPVRRDLDSPWVAGAAEALHAFFSSEGFTREPYSDKHAFCASHPSGVVMVLSYESGWGGVPCYIASRDDAFADALATKAIAVCPALRLL